MGEIKRILIIEDSPTVIEMMKLMLKDMNAKIFTAGSEFGMFQAIESFGKTVDLILMDITLKSENGLDLVAKLRANERYQDIPVIVVTEHANLDFVLRAKELKVSSFIRKPIEKSIFIDRLVETIQLETLARARKPILSADDESSASDPETQTDFPDRLTADPDLEASNALETAESTTNVNSSDTE